MKKLRQLMRTLFTKHRRATIGVILIAITGFLVWRTFLSPNTQQPQYQTTQAEKGTLITSITASGQITTANNVQITTQASGVVKDVMVKNGDTVTQGQIIAQLILDQASQQKAASAWSSYLSAQNSLAAAQVKMYSLQSSLFKANQAFVNDKGISNPTDEQKADPKYIEENADWLAAEADYNNQGNVITQVQAALNSAALSLSQTSSTITAPADGVMKGLTITPGAIVTVTSSSTNATSTSQVLGSVYQQGPIQAQVNLSEIDSVRAAEGQKATMTLDAFPDVTFTGKVVSINTNGITSSGVTNYPAVISFDTGNDHIYPNMGVSAKIITNIKNDILLVPSSAIQNQNGQTIVRILKNNNVTSLDVETGDANDTQTEIKSGISEGDTVVTGTTSPTNTRTQGASPFGTIGGRGFGGAGFGGGGFGGGAAARSGGR